MTTKEGKAARMAGMSEAKRMLLEKRLRGTVNRQQQQIQKRSVQDRLELSFAQRRLWFLQKLMPGDTSYHLTAAIRMKGHLHVGALERSVLEIVKRHESLRTRFVEQDGEPLQVIETDVRLTMPLAVWREGTPEREEALTRLIEESAGLPFALHEDFPIRTKLIRLEEEEHVLVVTLHHIASDGWSTGIFIRELSSLYESFSQDRPSVLPELPIQYADFAAWQNQQYQSGQWSSQQEYWQRELGGSLPVLELPTYRPRSLSPSNAGATYRWRFPKELTASLRQFAKQEEATLFMVLLAAFNILLYRYTGQEDLAVGTPIANRDLEEIEPLIGFFVNTLVLRTDISGDEVSFREILRRVREKTLQAYANQNMPFDKVVEMVAPDRNMSTTPLVQVMFALQNAPRTSLSLSGLTLSQMELETQTTQFDLLMNLTEDDEGLSLMLVYKTDLFGEERMHRLVRHYGTLLERAVEQPNAPVKRLPMLTEEELHLLLHEWNGSSKGKYPSIQHLFEQQVERLPNHQVAFVYRDEMLTYAELNGRANRLARYLQRRGVRQGALVGVRMERCPDLIVSLLAILKVGATYVPMDLNYPEERLRYMAEDAQVSALITQPQLLNTLPFENVPMICIDPEVIAQEDDSNLETGTTGDNVAYVMYTSGSTGKPKGVVVPHRGVIRLVTDTNYITLDENDAVLQFAPIAFDGSTFEIWGALINGGRLVLYPSSKPSMSELGQLLKAEKVTTVFLTTALFHQMIDEQPEDLIGVRQFVAGGDVLSVPHLKKAITILPNTRVINGYGPTENTTFTTCYSAVNQEEVGSSVPIGRPITNTQVYVLDRLMQPVPVGVPGELCTGGDGLAFGYLNRPDLNDEKFVQNPFTADPTAKLYKTGDLVRYLPDGNLEFLGRIDKQVKIRGFRIELGEIETHLIEYPGVVDAVVIDRIDPHGDKYLAAYLQCEEGNEPDVAALRRDLAASMPAYMIPTYFVYLDQLPVTANGKKDRQALPEPTFAGQRTIEYVSPRNDVEEKMAAIWSDLLNVEQIGIYDNFFELGGHSLKANSFVTRINRAFGVKLPLLEVFQHPTLGELADLIATLERNEYEEIEPIGGEGTYPVSYEQKRLYILNQIDEQPIAYNIPDVRMAIGDLDHARFAQALQALIERHESLRTSVVFADGELVQIVHDRVDFAVNVRQVEEADVERLVREFVRPFDLTKAPLLRVELLQVAPNKHYVLFDVHHIIADGTSMEVFIRDFIALFAGKKLMPLRVQYKDYAAWQSKRFASDEFKRQETFWKGIFAQEAPALDLPTDFPRPARMDFAGNTISYALDDALRVRLLQFASEQGVTLNMLLLAVYNVLLHRYTGQEDIVVGQPIAGRRHNDLAPIIGMFVNTLAMRNHPQAKLPFREFLQSVKQAALVAYENQDYPFDMLVEQLQLEHDISRNPIFDTMFALQSADTEVALSDVTFDRYEREKTIAKFDLSLYALETEHDLHLLMEYRTSLFRREKVEAMMQHFVQLLASILAEPHRALGDLVMLNDEEVKGLLSLGGKQTERPQETIHQVVERMAAQVPDRVALRFGESAMTYGEVNARANRLARLLQKRGIGQGQLVALLLERSPLMVISILAAWKVGAAYMPIDAEYPKERIETLLEDSQAGLLLTDSTCQKGQMFQTARLELDACEEELQEQAGEDLLLPVSVDDLAYVIYTSGSTGKPKGAMVEHVGMMNHIWAKVEDLALTEGDIIAQNASHCFDISVWQFFAALAVGGTTVIYSREITLDPDVFFAVTRSERVSILEVVPSFLHALLERFGGVTAEQRALPSLRSLLVTGEALPLELCRQWFALYPTVALVNAYGPTEASDDITHHIMTEAPQTELVPVGRAVRNFNLYVVDTSMNLLPFGAVGEICVSGFGVGRGYLRNAEKTQAVFLADPFVQEAGRRMYKTGDLGKFLPDGTLQYLGRLDHQVKIRGFRIELGEIEYQLLQLEGVREAIVLDRKDPDGNLYLCAYLINDRECSVQDLRHALMNTMPHYMIPSVFVFLERMPLSSNGKVDRKALLEPTLNVADQEAYVAPSSETERALAAVWADVLGIERVGVTENFMDLGGHSLKAMSVVAQIYKRLNVQLPIRAVFTHPTVRELAVYVDTLEAKEFVRIPAVPVADQYALSSSQKRLYLLDELGGAGTSYNIPGVLLLEGPMDRAKFEQAFQKLIARHEVLRSSFHFVNGTPVQRVHDQVEFTITYTKASEQELDDVIHCYLQPFDLSQAPLLRVTCVELANERNAILVDMHHIVSDGTSVHLLKEEFMQLYAGRDLPPLRIQYKDFSVWQNKWLESEEAAKQAAFWQDLFQGEIPVLNLSTDGKRQAERTFVGDMVRFSLGVELTEELERLTRAQGTTLFMTLLTAYQILLFKYTGDTDFVIGTPVAGRSHSDLERVMGMFVNTLPLRRRHRPEQTFVSLLEEAHQQTLQAFEYQEYPLDLLIESLDVQPAPGRNPLFDTMFVLQNVARQETLQLGDLTVRDYPFANGTAKFDLSLVVYESDGELQYLFEYASPLFARGTVEKIGEHFRNLLANIVKQPEARVIDLKVRSVTEQAAQEMPETQSALDDELDFDF